MLIEMGGFKYSRRQWSDLSLPSVGDTSRMWPLLILSVGGNASGSFLMSNFDMHTKG